jgi:rSAM/selenodomain-associated transferase 2
MASTPAISVVIPVRDDAAELRALLAELSLCAEPVETVVVLGDDDPREADTVLAAWPRVTRLKSAPGRGVQMNVGAATARGRWLVFLHADTRLESGWVDEILALDVRADVGWGCFRLALRSSAWQARIIERGVAVRAARLRVPYGDQALFVRRDLFESMGGFRPFPLMEDVDLVCRLRRCPARFWPSERRAFSSARRWEREGWARRTLGNIGFVALYLAGVSPGRLARAYYAGGNKRRQVRPYSTEARLPSRADPVEEK